MQHYDALPYESNAFPETHPRNLATLAALFRLPAAQPGACRVLELGCAAGGNLIPMAWHLPGSEFVGVDLEPAQIREGQALVAELDLDNVSLIRADLAALDESLGRFDYIITHGVFSWVPEPVRQAIFSLYRRLLAPTGIGYISYNTRPGWHVRGMVREMLLYHTRDIDDPLESLNAAMEFIGMYAESLERQPGPLAQHLLLELKSLAQAHPSYLYHEFLESDNQPLLVSEFVAQAEGHGLRYLCECQLEGMFPSHLGGRAEAFLATVEDSARHEQYLDFFKHRTFRQSLLVQAEAAPDYEIDLSCLERYACAADLAPPAKLDLRRPTAQRFTTPYGKEVQVEDPVAKAMLAVMYQHYPSALPIAELVTRAEAEVHQAQGGQADLAAAWQGEVFNLYANCLVELVLEPLSRDPALPRRPRLNALARAWVARGARNIPTVWHHAVNTDPFSLRLLGYLDGRHDRQALLEHLLADMKQGRLELPGMAGEGGRWEPMIAANLDRLLALFARNGLFEPERPDEKSE